jgi:hypothetical protein
MRIGHVSIDSGTDVLEYSVVAGVAGRKREDFLMILCHPRLYQAY